MPVSIIACPSCKSLLLSDTVQCPTCRHTLRPDEADNYAASGYQDDTSSEGPCPSCGEMVRHGMVRCWSCGGFMRQDMAALYERMQSTPSPVIYSQTPGEAPPEPAGSEDQSTTVAEDEDFELAGGFSTGTAPAGSGAATATYGLGDAPAADAAADATAATNPEKTEKPLNGEAAHAPQPEPSVPHSVATGGDVLLQVALQEEAEAARRGKGRRRGPRALHGFLVYCPMGHRIEVQEKHRGLTGRCRKCKSPFFVPLKEAVPQAAPGDVAAQSGTAGALPAAASVAGKYRVWMNDVRLHTVNPAKLKLKPGSLEKDFQAVDVGFSRDGLLLVTLVKSGGLFGAPDKKKKAAARDAVLAHLKEDKPLDQLPAASKQTFDAEAMKTIAVAQPYPYAHESMFAGIPVFGNGRIAVRLPRGAEGDPPKFLSFVLSEYRTFAAGVADCFGVQNLGEEFGIPLHDKYTELTCHYSENKVQSLESLEFYQADPTFKLERAGRRCAACSLVVSEDSRKKEKIGGANGKGIAKAKCPKCGGKFGDVSLWTLPQPEKKAEETPAEAAQPEPAGAGA